MKKSLLAFAILGAFAGAAFAQSSVTIYGVVDAGLERYDNGTVTANRLTSGIQSGSRLGFRGNEDLGGGLSAIFTLESGFNVDDGTSGQGGRLFGRQAFVGVNSNSFGALKLGRQYNPIRIAVENTDPFGLGLAGRADNMFNVYGDRADNTVNYSTPTWGGFNGQVAYSLGEVAGNNSIGRQWGASVGYGAGPASAVLAYHRQNIPATVGGVVVDNGSASTVFLGGAWDFGVAKVHAAFAKDRGDTALGVRNIDQKEGMLGVTVPFGPHKVLGSYTRRNNNFAGIGNANEFAIGYTYDFSKRTNFYTSYGYTRNDTGSVVGIALNSPPPVPGNDPKLFNIGVRHRF